ncbi:hypothetical protein [Lysinibacillus phage vB_LspM-01]|nr:hypothetical protein [Lysinibacillus phage vB_LspM-01]
MRNAKEILKIFSEPQQVNTVVYNAADGKHKLMNDLQLMSETYTITARELAALLVETNIPDGTVFKKQSNGFLHYGKDVDFDIKKSEQRDPLTLVMPYNPLDYVKLDG